MALDLFLLVQVGGYGCKGSWGLDGLDGLLGAPFGEACFGEFGDWRGVFGRAGGLFAGGGLHGGWVCPLTACLCTTPSPPHPPSNSRTHPPCQSHADAATLGVLSPPPPPAHPPTLYSRTPTLPRWACCAPPPPFPHPPTPLNPTHPPNPPPPKQSHADAATLGVLCSTTGGSLYRYSPFAPAADQDQLLNDLKWNVARPQVGGGVLFGGLGVGGVCGERLVLPF